MATTRVITQGDKPVARRGHIGWTLKVRRWYLESVIGYDLADSEGVPS